MRSLTASAALTERGYSRRRRPTRNLAPSSRVLPLYSGLLLARIEVGIPESVAL